MVEHAYACIEDCLQDEPAFCTAACPFGLDLRDFAEKLQRGAFQAAYRGYANAVGFPGIVSALCPEPCKAGCPRAGLGGAVELRRLERAAMAHARSLEPNCYNVPRKPGRVAIVGAGPGGLALALRLAEKNYAVTVYEGSGRIGGHLHGLMDSAALMADIERAFTHAAYELRLGTEVRDLESLEADAVYVATGRGGEAFGLLPDPDHAFASARPGFFLGGSLSGSDSMGAIADGLRACAALEHFLKSGNLKPAEARPSTRLTMDGSRFAALPARAPAGAVYTKEEAVAEAKRCLRCACDACYRACDLMRYFRKYPRRIAEEVHLSVHPGTLDGNGTLATRLISTCSQCGLCKEVCPVGIDTGEIFLHGHRAMRERGAMPWAFHEFFLQDMAFANGEAGLSRLPKGQGRARYLFFPGCQLGASDPRYVTESYRFLRERWPDTALHLGCCGAPAEWAGDEPLRDEATARLREAWESFGRPTAVLACPSCKLILGRYLPDMECLFIYDLMLEAGLQPAAAGGGEAVSVFDPCASRGEPVLQGAIRELARRAGFSLEPLPMEGRLAQCCSWGGQVSIAHPPYARHMARARVEESGNPYLAYCSNCRDTFARARKPVRHILDILFGLNGADRAPPTLSERRRNRLALKRLALEEFWGEGGGMKETGTKLIIAAELRKKLDAELILEEDIEKVVEYCEASGRKVLDPETGSCSGHLKIGGMTFWAEYRPAGAGAPGGGFELINAYGHRMSIEEG